MPAEPTNAPSTGARKTAAKRAPAKTAAPKKATTPAPAEPSNVNTFALEPTEPTKRWAKFSPPADSGCIGTLYAPLGTKSIKVRLES